ncbi:kelch-like protein diablo isoform X2 [Ptychodera flava]|uniref:kelch-like protein diablo isoform X2 n=1 Tax=Ptychodera flava TaxID=63121 RepID=UPI00396A5D82
MSGIILLAKQTSRLKGSATIYQYKSMAGSEELVYQDGCLSNSVLETLQSFRSTGTLCDVVIEVEQCKIPAHRLVLSACSPYFRAMFTGQLAESSQECVTIRDSNPNAIKDLIDFAYTATVKINDANVQDLMISSNLLQLTGVRSACCEFLQRQLHPSNCIGIWHFADAHSCHELAEKARQYLYEHFAETAKEEEFLHLKYEQLTKLIGSDFLGVSNESEVFGSVIRWVKEDAEKRMCHLSTLLEKIRLFQVSPEFLLDQLNNEVVLAEIPEYCKMLSEVQRVLQGVNNVDNVLRKYGKGRRKCYSKRPKGLLAIGGESNGSTLTTVQCHVLDESCWTTILPHSDYTSGNSLNKIPISPMNTPRSAFGVVSDSNIVYVVGGSNSMHALNSVEKYDVMANKWEELGAMHEPRHGTSVSVLNGQLYACGGQDDSQYLDTVEVYSHQTNTWNYVPSMKHKRAFFGTAVVGGMLYAVGGTGGNKGNKDDFLTSIERYDPSQQIWTSVAPMHIRRAYVSVAVVNNCIYAIGGFNREWLNSVERYDPDSNQWTFVKPMNKLRSSACATALNGCIYVVGGFDSSKCTNTVDKYDPALNKWSSACPMLQRRYGVGVATVMLC